MTEFDQKLEKYRVAAKSFVEASNAEVKAGLKTIAARKALLLAKEELRDAERNCLNY